MFTQILVHSQAGESSANIDSQRFTTETRWIIVRTQVQQRLSQRAMLPRKRASEMDCSRVRLCHIVHRGLRSHRCVREEELLRLPFERGRFPTVCVDVAERRDCHQFQKRGTLANIGQEQEEQVTRSRLFLTLDKEHSKVTHPDKMHRPPMKTLTQKLGLIIAETPFHSREESRPRR